MHKLNIILALSACLLISACSIMTPRPTATHGKDHTDRIAADKHAERSRQTRLNATPTSALQEDGTAAGQTHDVWARIRNGLVLDRHLSDPTVQSKIRWYARRQNHLTRVAERATPYLYHIVEELEKRDMPLDLALLPIIESAYHPFAYSRSHASGIWQFIPETGKNYGLKQNWWYDGRRDIVAATKAALRYLDTLEKEFNGDWLQALAAYNCGERNVGRAIKRNKLANKATDFFSLRLPGETRAYVPSLLAVAEILANPDKYKISWQAIADKPYFAQVDVQQQIDLATAAALLDVDMDTFYTLNPGYNRWATAADGPHSVLVPIAQEHDFIQAVAALPDSQKIKWQRHVIKKGETLAEIAGRYRMSLETLRTSNKISGHLLSAGNSLLIPVASRPAKHYTLSLDNRRFRGLKAAGEGAKYTYTIKRGDTLWDIGRHYGFSVKQLLAWNGINSRTLLRPGQKIILWLDKNATQTATAVKTSHRHPLSNYTVKRGDSLWLISRRLGVSVADLRQWNKLSGKSYLQPGQKLIIQPGGAKKTET